MMMMMTGTSRSGEEDAEHVLDGPPAHRAGVRRAGARRAKADVHARVAGHLASPLPADDARVLRRPRRPGAAGLRLGPGEREARELRGDVYVGVALRRIASIGHGLLPGLSESTRLPHRWHMRYRRLPSTRPTPRDRQEPICPRKKRVIWTRWRPVPVKNVNYPRAPNSRRSGLVGPHTTPAIVDYKYMTSTL